MIDKSGDIALEDKRRTIYLAVYVIVRRLRAESRQQGGRETTSVDCGGGVEEHGGRQGQGGGRQAGEQLGGLALWHGHAGTTGRRPSATGLPPGLRPRRETRHS